MKVQFTYKVVVVLNEEGGADFEKALETAATAINSSATVKETDAEEQPEPEPEGDNANED